MRASLRAVRATAAGELAVRGPEEAGDLVSQNRPDAVILDSVFCISKPSALVSSWICFLA